MHKEQPKNEQNGKTEQLNAEEFLKSKYFSREHQKDGYVLDFDELKDLLEDFDDERKDEIQQRDLTIQELSEQLIESNQSKKTITEEEIGKECWERYNLYNSQFSRGKREGFLECAKWIREKLK